MVDLGELSISVESEGVDEAADKVQGATEGDGGGGLLSGVSGPAGGGKGGGALGSLMGTLSGMSSAMMGILGAVGLIAALLASLKPIQKMIGALFKVIQAFVMPLAVMLMRLLSPVLGFLLRLLPIWMDFLSDPQGAISDAISWLRGVLFNMATKLVNSLISKLPDWLTKNNNNTTPDKNRTFSTENDLRSLKNRRDKLNGNGTSDDNGTNINFWGGIGTFIERWSQDPTTPNGPGPGP